MGPAGEKYRNLGRVNLTGVNETGRRTEVGVNVAQGVKQLLLSVAEVNDYGSLVVMDSYGGYEGSKVVRVDTPEGQAIRAAVTKSNGSPH